MRKKCEHIIQELTGKKNVFFVDKGNSAILLALKFAKEKTRKIYLPKEGGWITYKQFAEKLKFEIEFVNTDNGYINLDKLKIENGTSVILNSMSAYSFLLDMEKFSEKCVKKDCFLINDVSASIGTEQAKFGDIIIGSFGRWKPLNVEYGGFIATDIDFKDFFDNNFNKEVEDFFDKLYDKLSNLEKRLAFFNEKRGKVLEDLKEYDIIHREKLGINVIVKFHDIKEKENLIKYCEKEDLEYILCPMNIKVNCDAISIEIQRL